VQLVRIGFVSEHRAVEVIREGVPDRVSVVLEVEDERVVLLRMRPVQARQGLHCLDARQGLVHVHRVQQRLVVARLELFGAYEEAVGVFLEAVRNVARREAVEGRLRYLHTAGFVFAGERNDRAVQALALAQIVGEGVEILDRASDAVRDHHRPGLAANPVPSQHLIVEVVHHDLRLQANGVVVALHVAPQFALCLSRVELGIVLDRLGQPVVAQHRCVVLDDVHDEALLDGLLHRVAVERPVPDGAVRLRVGFAEQFQRLVLGCRGEGEVACVREQLARLHDAVDPVLVDLVLLDPSRF